jgi:hypothetical protein
VNSNSPLPIFGYLPAEATGPSKAREKAGACQWKASAIAENNGYKGSSI